jgi:hypothetical protein
MTWSAPPASWHPCPLRRPWTATIRRDLIAVAARTARHGLCRARTCAIALSWCSLCPLRCPSVFVDQALDDVPALDPSGHIDRVAGLVQRRSLFPRLVRPMLVIVPRVLGQSPPEMLFAVDQEVVKALTPLCSHIPLRKGVRQG